MRSLRPAPPAPLLLLNAANVESDEELVTRLRLGDRSALAALFHRHAGPLLRLAGSLTATPADAEDVVQDVFVGLPLAVRRYEERGAFAAWLRGVTARTALATRRRSARRHQDIADLENVSSAGASSAERHLAVQDAVDALPDDQREVFVLKVIEGYSHTEIAELLGIRSGTSEVRLFRAIRRLRTLLSESP